MEEDSMLQSQAMKITCENFHLSRISNMEKKGDYKKNFLKKFLKSAGISIINVE